MSFLDKLKINHHPHSGALDLLKYIVMLNHAICSHKTLEILSKKIISDLIF